jgi:hypothetical protein
MSGAWKIIGLSISIKKIDWVPSKKCRAVQKLILFNFLDSDDYLDLKKIQIQINDVIQYDISICDYSPFDDLLVRMFLLDIYLLFSTNYK